MTDTPRLGFPEIASGQSDKSSTHNDGLTRADLLVQGWVQDKDLTAPPGGESDGQVWIVGGSATGAWATHDKALAYFRSSAWTFFPASGSPGAAHEGLTVWVRDENKLYSFDGTNWVETQGAAVKKAIIIAVTDETTAITGTGTQISFRMPFAMTLTAVRANLSSADSANNIVVDINEGGASILSTKITIEQGETTSLDATTQPVISDANLADDAVITIDIDSTGTNATGLKVTLIGTAA